MRSFQLLRDSLTAAALGRVIASGDIDRLIAQVLSDAALARAFLPVTQEVRNSIARSVRLFAADLPRAGRVENVLAVSFDVLNPKVIDAIRALDTRVMGTLKSDAREVVRAFVENGLRDGVSPAEIARGIRQVMGLAPNQELAVRNFRRALEGVNGARNPLDYELRDRRYDKLLKRGGYTTDQIDAMTDAYRRKMLAFNAETNARTASLDAMKLGQHLSWQDAIDKGIVDGDRLRKTWIGVMDNREREEHVAMEGETVGFDEQFSNGELIPGESTFNCRCISRYTMATRSP